MSRAEVGAILLFVMLAFAWGGYALRDISADKDLAECSRLRSEERSAAASAALSAAAKYRAAEQQTNTLQREALNAAHAETQAANADRDRLRRALDRLRMPGAPASSPIGGSAPGGPATSAAGQAAGPAGDLPPDLLVRLGDAARELAEAADASRIAGRACERHYDALMPRKD
jgi:hypothetical protein